MSQFPVPGNHTEENKKISIEKILDNYKFDKTKISGIVCDESSSLVRLFSQLLLEPNSVTTKNIEKSKYYDFSKYISMK